MRMNRRASRAARSRVPCFRSVRTQFRRDAVKSTGSNPETGMKQVRRKHVAVDVDADDAAANRGTMQLAQKLLDLVSDIPVSRERALDAPEERAQALIRAAKTRAAIASGSLSLPPGPLGWITVLPEIYAVWRIQAQLVSDLAAVHGRKSTLSREQMLYCLFRHAGAQLFRDLILRVGERYLVRRLPLRSLYAIANKIGMRITQRSLGRAVARVLPVAGALGVAGYSWYDTRQVSHTALELFRSEVEVEPAAAKTRQIAARRVTGAAARERTTPPSASPPSATPRSTPPSTTRAKPGSRRGKPR
jgi:hypothetical protein